MAATISQLAQASPLTNAVAENDTNSTENVLSARDIGFFFVHEYYTYLNNNPNKIHAFYSHDSIMVRGNEGEDPVTAQGGEAIRRCLEETPLESTKVRLDSVDSVGSAHNGILVQVLGDMVNSSIGVRRFSQTFFLATQPNGFYVLTDILRFLKDDPVLEETAKEGNQQKQHAPVSDTTTLADADAAVTTTTTTTTTTAPAVSASATTLTSPDVDNTYLDKTAATTALTSVTESAKIGEEEAQHDGTPAAKMKEGQKEQGEAVVTAATHQEDENKPKTPKPWSVIAAGTDAKRNMSPSEPGSPVTESKSDSQRTSSKPAHHKEQQNTSNRESVPKEEQTDVFLKNVKNLTNDQIKEAFTAAIGEVKSVMIHNNKTTAFLTFATPESCRKALEQSHVDVGEVTVLIEERRPPTSRFPRHHQNGGGRGESFSERRFGQNRRGGGSSRGSKSRGSGSGSGSNAQK